MKEITATEFNKFLEKNRQVIVGGATIKLGVSKKINLFQPENFELERTNAWSFPVRGTWATHKGNFRGNWPPQMARNIILRYSKPGEAVLTRCADPEQP